MSQADLSGLARLLAMLGRRTTSHMLLISFNSRKRPAGEPCRLAYARGSKPEMITVEYSAFAESDDLDYARSNLTSLISMETISISLIGLRSGPRV
jgi:hypothetical protein